MAGLHAVTVPVLLRYLQQLDGLMQRLDTFARDGGHDEATLLATALAEDMFDLRRQVLIAANFSVRALKPIAPELEALGPAEGERIADLRLRIAERIAALSALDPQAIDAAEALPASERAGEAMVETDALTFATAYALPNFFFHLASAYAILRHLGVPIGKPDFDGFHAYPPGFRFV